MTVMFTVTKSKGAIYVHLHTQLISDWSCNKSIMTKTTTVVLYALAVHIHTIV